MAELTITSTAVSRVKQVSDNISTGPAAEAITAGQLVRLDTSTGKFTLANCTSTEEARVYGIALVTAAAGMPLSVIRRGLVDIGNALSAVAYDAKLYLGFTDGAIADATPTRNEAQTITITGTPTGGTFTLTLDGQTTGSIAYDASASTVLTAIRALSNVENDDVSATGGALPGTAVVVTFAGKYAGTDVPLMTATSSLTGGTAPAIAITTTTTPRIPVVIGRCVPAFGATTADKLVSVEL